MDDIWMELANRSTKLGADYPFAHSRTGLEARTWQPAHLTYCTLLLLSTLTTCGLAAPLNWNEEAKVFEMLAALALGRYITGDALRMGWPREGEMPQDFAEALDYVKKRTNEEGPLGNVVAKYPNAKDGGVDVIAWKPFRDGRSGQVILLGQCAVGLNWGDKLRDFSMERWKRYLGCSVPPVRAFLMPHADNPEDLWDGLCLETEGVVLDRFRVAETAGRVPGGGLRRRVASWCRERVDAIRGDLDALGWDY